MKKYVRCKVCGFVTEEKNVKDVCPACGVPKTAFIEHKPIISEKRNNVLNLHIHPILVHMPEAIAIMSIIFLVGAFTTDTRVSNDFTATVKVLSMSFPIFIAAAIISGIYDGKIRFKKLSPPLLRIKIYLGIALCAASLFTAILTQIDTLTAMNKVEIILLSIINLGLCTALGKIGGTLGESKMPG